LKQKEARKMTAAQRDDQGPTAKEILAGREKKNGSCFVGPVRGQEETLTGVSRLNRDAEGEEQVRVLRGGGGHPDKMEKRPENR